MSALPSANEKLKYTISMLTVNNKKLIFRIDGSYVSSRLDRQSHPVRSVDRSCYDGLFLMITKSGSVFRFVKNEPLSTRVRYRCQRHFQFLIRILKKCFFPARSNICKSLISLRVTISSKRSMRLPFTYAPPCSINRLAAPEDPAKPTL
jgi:hypothetical protein